MKIENSGGKKFSPDVSSPKNLFITSIIGPKQSGKTTLLKSIINHFTRAKKWICSGVVSILNSNGEVIIFVENNSDILSIVNCTTFSDLIVSMIDGFLGLELEIFETIALAKKSGLKRYVFFLTHLDLFKTWKSLKKAKKRIKERLVKETNGNCKIFYLSGTKANNLYFPGEINNFTRYLNKVRTNYNPPIILQNCAIISRIEFPKTIKKNIAFFTGYLNNELFFTKKYKHCFIPGLGNGNILSIKKITKKLDGDNGVFDSKNIFSGLSSLKYNIMHAKKSEGVFYPDKNKSLKKFFTFLSNLKHSKNYLDENSPTISLIDSKKIFFSFSLSKEVLKIDNLITIFKDIYQTRGIFKKNINNQNTYLTSRNSNFLIKNHNKYSSTFGKYCLTLNGFSPIFRKYHNAYNFLVIRFTKTTRKKIIAKITKNKWERSVLNSGKNYIISIGWKIIVTKLYFCNHKNNEINYIMKNLKFSGFSYICFYTDSNSFQDIVVGIKTKSQARNSIHQGTSFSFLFTGEVLFFNNVFKMFKRIKIKGIIFKKYKKSAFIRGMFSSSIDATKFRDAIIKTTDGIRGIIKNTDQITSTGNFRAIFEKKIQNETSVSIVTYINVTPDKNSYEILSQLIPTDQRELYY
jgi:hypothetical protein